MTEKTEKRRITFETDEDLALWLDQSKESAGIPYTFHINVALREYIMSRTAARVLVDSSGRYTVKEEETP